MMISTEMKIKKVMEKEVDKYIDSMEKQEQNVPSMQKAKFIPPRIRPRRIEKND